MGKSVPVKFDPAAAAADFGARLAAQAPLVRPWTVGTGLVRCHPNRWGPVEFFAGRPARFSPFTSLVPPIHHPGEPLRVLYTSDNEAGALSETVFRDLPLRGRKTISRSGLQKQNLSRLVMSRELRLADLTGHGLPRLGLTRRDIIESDRRAYRLTALFAQAVHAHAGRFDGMVWVSRQHDVSLGVVLFEDRLRPNEVDPEGPTYPLAFGYGREVVDGIADDLGITIVDP